MKYLVLLMPLSIWFLKFLKLNCKCNFFNAVLSFCHRKANIFFRMSLCKGLKLPHTFNFEVTLFMLGGEKHLLCVC